MFCDAYNKSLTEAAAAGRELTPALQQHLSACESCSKAFAEEQSLFATVDAGVHVAANAEVPTTLVPRIHVALNSEAIPQIRNLNFLSGFAGATFTAAVVLGLLYFPSKRPATPTKPAPISVATLVKNPPEQPALNSVPKSGVSSLHQVKPEVLATSNTSRREVPEVLVPPEEGAALIRYEEFLRRKQAGLVRTASTKSLDLPQGIEPLQIKEIEVVALDIPILSKSDSEDDTK